MCFYAHKINFTSLSSPRHFESCPCWGRFSKAQTGVRHPTPTESLKVSPITSHWEWLIHYPSLLLSIACTWFKRSGITGYMNIYSCFSFGNFMLNCTISAVPLIDQLQMALISLKIFFLKKASHIQRSDQTKGFFLN